MVYVLEVAQVGRRHRRARIRCHMGWFSLSAVDPKKSQKLQKSLDLLSLDALLARARALGDIDEDSISACEAGRCSRSVLVQRMLDLAASYQRLSNPNAFWARIVQVEPCTTPMLLPGSELRIGSEFAPHLTTLAKTSSTPLENTAASRVPAPMSGGKTPRPT